MKKCTRWARRAAAARCASARGSTASKPCARSSTASTRRWKSDNSPAKKAGEDDLERVLRQGLLQRLFDIIPETGEYYLLEVIAVAQRQQRRFDGNAGR